MVSTIRWSVKCRAHCLTSAPSTLTATSVQSAFFFHGSLLTRLVDALDHKTEKGLFTQELKSLLEDNSKLKVVNDCGKLAKSLLQTYDITLRNVFDTQIAFRWYQLHTPLSITFPYANISKIAYRLCKIEEFKISKIITKDLQVNSKLWMQRPLSFQMIKLNNQETASLARVYQVMYANMNDQLQSKVLQFSSQVIEDVLKNPDGIPVLRGISLEEWEATNKPSSSSSSSSSPLPPLQQQFIDR